LFICAKDLLIEATALPPAVRERRRDGPYLQATKMLLVFKPPTMAEPLYWLTDAVPNGTT
jgi:hypothetical protein